MQKCPSTLEETYHAEMSEYISSKCRFKSLVSCVILYSQQICTSRKSINQLPKRHQKIFSQWLISNVWLISTVCFSDTILCRGSAFDLSLVKINLPKGYIYIYTHSWGLDQVWSISPALELLPLNCSCRSEQSRGSNSNAGKMDRTWSSWGLR